MVDSVPDRYRKAEKQRLGGIPALAQAIQPAPQQPMLNPDMIRKLAEMFSKPKEAPQGQAYQAPYAGLHNQPAGPDGLPPFQQPGSSLPMDSYMPQAVTEPHQLPPMPPMQAQAPMQTPAVPHAPEMPPPMDAGPGAPSGVPSGIEGLAMALAKSRAEPWAANQGNLADQYPGFYGR